MSPSNFLYAYLFQIGFLAFNMRRSFVTCERSLLSKLARDGTFGRVNSLILLSWSWRQKAGCRCPPDAVQIAACGALTITPC
jgi:hypothetical protein